MQKNYFFRVMAIAMIFLFGVEFAFSQKKAKIQSNTYHNLAGGNFSQDWTNVGLITANDNWSSVPVLQKRPQFEASFVFIDIKIIV